MPFGTFITGVTVGIISTLVVLPLFSKLLIKLAAKRQLNSIMGHMNVMESKVDDMIKDMSKGGKEEQNGTEKDSEPRTG